MTRRTAVVVTVSDGAHHGAREDTSGDAVAATLREAGWTVADRVTVPDEVDRITAALRESAAAAALVVTTGGTGFGPRDVTPEATALVATRHAPGLAERMRAIGRQVTPMADLSRATAVVVDTALVVNLPGSRKGAVESLEAVLELLPHAVQLLGGDTGDHPEGHGSDGEPGEHVDPVGADTPVGVDHDHGEGDHDHGEGDHDHGDDDGRDDGRDHDHDHDPDDPCALAHAAGVPDERRPGTLVAVYSSPLSSLLLSWGRDLGYHRLVLVEPDGQVGHAPAHADEVVESVAAAGVDDDTDVVVTDHGRDDIVELTDQMLDTEARYLGLMGSARHTGPHVEGLRERGRSHEEIGRIERPVGLDIGSKTPPEIALSVLAGIVADRQGTR